MINISIPDFGDLQLTNLILDYNGTIAFDGELYEGLDLILTELSERIDIHILTADTFGTVKKKLERLPVKLSILATDEQDKEKMEYVKKLGKTYSVCIGNGRNDRLMLKEAALGIALIQDEGACTQTILSADIVCKSIQSALGLLTDSKRMIATLRS